MSKKIFLKKCGINIYGWDIDENLYLFDSNESEKLIGKLRFDYDFCINQETFFSIKDRIIHIGENKKELNLDFPVRIKVFNNFIYILDQEKASLYKFNFSFNLREFFGQKGLVEFENKFSILLLFPLDFDIFEDRIAIIDVGNRRTIVFNKELTFKKSFPVIGKKIRFLDENKLLILFGEEIYKIDINENNIAKTSYDNILDFEVVSSGELLLIKEDI